MRLRLTVVVAMFFLLLLPSVAQAKHPDYRPWKAAMFGWYDHYEQSVWFPAVHAAWADGTYTDPVAIMESPPVGWSMTTDVNRWDWQTRNFAMFITAIEGPFPCTLFTARLREILSPFLLSKTGDYRARVTRQMLH